MVLLIGNAIERKKEMMQRCRTCIYLPLNLLFKSNSDAAVFFSGGFVVATMATGREQMEGSPVTLQDTLILGSKIFGVFTSLKHYGNSITTILAQQS